MSREREQVKGIGRKNQNQRRAYKEERETMGVRGLEVGVGGYMKIGVGSGGVWEVTQIEGGGRKDT